MVQFRLCIHPYPRYMNRSGRPPISMGRVEACIPPSFLHSVAGLEYQWLQQGTEPVAILYRKACQSISQSNGRNYNFLCLKLQSMHTSIRPDNGCLLCLTCQCIVYDFFCSWLIEWSGVINQVRLTTADRNC